MYQRRSSPLHAARPLSAVVYNLGLLTLAAVYFGHPVVLVAVIAATTAAMFAARVARPLPPGVRFGLGLALVWMLLNPFVDHNGLTVLARLGSVPPLGEVDVTLEAIVYGAVLGLSVIAIVSVTALSAATLDPDELLRSFRRLSFRSALTAALATRLVPVLATDAQRLADAQRCRADGGGRGLRARTQVVQAVMSGALERAIDVAATLEVRGYGAARRPPRLARPWSRHDVAFLAAGLGLVALAVVARLTGVGDFDAYPKLRMALGAPELAVAGAVFAIGLAPFLDRRGIDR